jgi:hypothetical protein
VAKHPIIKKGGNAPSGHNTDNSAQLTTILSDAGGSNSKIYTHCTTTFLKKREYINIPASASINAYSCSLLQPNTQRSTQTQKQQSFEAKQKKLKVPKATFNS